MFAMIWGFASAMGPPCDILSLDERTSQAAIIAAGIRGGPWGRWRAVSGVRGRSLSCRPKTFPQERAPASGSRRRSQASVRLARRVAAVGEQPFGARVDDALPVRERGLGDL